MFRIDDYRSKLLRAQRARTATQKGRTYEALCKYLFNSMKGVRVHKTNVLLPTEELDLVLYNARLDQPFDSWDGIVLVECKNWSSAAGASVLDSFIAKIRRKGLKNGIFIAAQGVTGAFYGHPGGVGAAGIITQALSEGIRVIVLTNDDLEGVRSLKDFRELLINKYCGIFVNSFD